MIHVLPEGHCFFCHKDYEGIEHWCAGKKAYAAEFKIPPTRCEKGCKTKYKIPEIAFKPLRGDTKKRGQSEWSSPHIDSGPSFREPENAPKGNIVGLFKCYVLSSHKWEQDSYYPFRRRCSSCGKAKWI